LDDDPLLYPVMWQATRVIQSYNSIARTIMVDCDEKEYFWVGCKF
jgi:hypothetical protein